MLYPFKGEYYPLQYQAAFKKDGEYANIPTSEISMGNFFAFTLSHRYLMKLKCLASNSKYDCNMLLLQYMIIALILHSSIVKWRLLTKARKFRCKCGECGNFQRCKLNTNVRSHWCNSAGKNVHFFVVWHENFNSCEIYICKSFALT